MIQFPIHETVHNWFRRLRGEALSPSNRPLTVDRGVIHVGSRAYTKIVPYRGRRCIKKVFAKSPEAKAAFNAERTANEMFNSHSWMSPWLRSGRNWFVRPMYPTSSRLDNVVGSLGPKDRLRLAGKVLSIILDIHSNGCAHRDLHAKNMYYVDDELKLVDYESLAILNSGRCPRFRDCYDITGYGIDSPYRTLNMGYSSQREYAAGKVLGIDINNALEELTRILKDELRSASLTFETQGSRHVCKAARIYSAFTLNNFRVDVSEAQRDCARRVTSFVTDAQDIRGRRVLDLGCNIGGMLFEVQKYTSGECLGIECDSEKVRIARRVAALCDLTKVRFQLDNVDKLSADAIGGPWDVVMCLSINKHVRNIGRLYQLLGKATGEVLWFEGNAGTEARDVEEQLRAVGFIRVERLGFCDDDCLPENNRRLIMRAWK